MVEMVSNPHMHNLVRWAENRPEAVVLSGDLTGSTEISLFRDRYPDRFFSMGMAEQNMLSFAGGLAREGLIPMVHTFAVFIYRRALDQIEMSIAYPNLRVRMFGFLPGITTPGGASHQAIDDIGVLRAVPNMTVLEMGDATDVESVLAMSEEVDGPLYVRMLRKSVPRLFPAEQSTRLGVARRIRRGSDLTLLSSGICTQEAIAAAEVLASQGLGIDHFHVTTLKPFTDEAIVESAARSRYGVLTMENHSVRGGLATAAAELLSSRAAAARITAVGIPDTYMHGASQGYLARKYGLTAEALVHTVAELTGESFTTGDIQRQQMEEQAGETRDEQLEAL